MNYSNHSLRSDLQEWKNRLYRAPFQQFGNQLQFFFSDVEKNKQLMGLMSEAMIKYPYSDVELDQVIHDRRNEKYLIFDSGINQAAFCYQFLKHCITKFNSYNLHHYTTFQKGQGETIKGIIEEYLAPIFHYLHDRLDKSNSTIFLLEKYKKRTEWFTKKELLKSYQEATKNFEQILDDDLRLFLFDQGVDYPFSTPSSTSGRADIIGEIDTEDPLIIEIKVLDKEKGYGKDRIKDGFSQIVKYANDYRKDVGYLIIFNMDAVEINIKTNEVNRVFPPSYLYNNKMFYFIVVNCGNSESASKTGTLKEIVITMEELTRSW